jgi:hypothetical protein
MPCEGLGAWQGSGEDEGKAVGCVSPTALLSLTPEHNEFTSANVATAMGVEHSAVVK